MADEPGHHELPELHMQFGAETRVIAAQVATVSTASGNMERWRTKEIAAPAFAPLDDTVTQKFQHDEDRIKFNAHETFIAEEDTSKIEFELTLRNTIHKNTKLDKKIGKAVVDLALKRFYGDVKLLDEFGDEEAQLNIAIVTERPVEEEVHGEMEKDDASTVADEVADADEVAEAEDDDGDADDEEDKGVYEEEDSADGDVDENTTPCAEDTAEQGIKENKMPAVTENTRLSRMPPGAYSNTVKKKSKAAKLCGAVTGREPKEDEGKKKKFLFF